MDNPLMLCQLSSFSPNSRNLRGVGQLLLEAYTQADEIRRALATVAQRCEVFINEFEQLAQSPGLQSLLSGPAKAEVHSLLFRRSSSNNINHLGTLTRCISSVLLIEILQMLATMHSF